MSEAVDPLVPMADEIAKLARRVARIEAIVARVDATLGRVEEANGESAEAIKKIDEALKTLSSLLQATLVGPPSSSAAFPLTSFALSPNQNNSGLPDVRRQRIRQRVMGKVNKVL